MAFCLQYGFVADICSCVSLLPQQVAFLAFLMFVGQMGGRPAHAKAPWMDRQQVGYASQTVAYTAWSSAEVIFCSTLP